MNFGVDWSGGPEWWIRSGIAVAWLGWVTRCRVIQGSRAWVWMATSLALVASIPWRWHGGMTGTGWSVGGDASGSMGTLGGGLTVLWALGAVVVLARRVCGAWRLHSWCRDGERLPPGHRWHRAWDQAAVAVGLAPGVCVRRIPGLRTPAVWVGRRTWLLIPRSADDWPLETCRRVCLHEAGHVRGGDGWLQWLWLAVDVLQWWNPLWWRMRGRLELELEKLADAVVVDGVGGSPRDYVADLLSCAERGLAGVASWGGDGGLEERVEALLQRGTMKRLRGLIAGLALATLVLLTLLFRGPAPSAVAADPIAADADLRLTAIPFPGN